MNTKPTHTPTPWRVVNETIIVRLEYDGKDAAICDVRTGAADAAFIVRAVNAHEELIETMKAAIRDLDRAE